MYDTRFAARRKQIGTLLVSAAMGLLTLSAAQAQSNVMTWGGGGSGRMGDGVDDLRAYPASTFRLTNVISQAGGKYHALAVRADGEVWTWGYNSSGQLGDGTTTRRYAPVQVQNLTGVIKVAGGGYHSLALKANGTVWAWGANNYGQLGIGAADANPHKTPVQVGGLTGIVAIAAGENHSLAVKNDGTLYAWGYNQYGQIGDNSIAQRNAPYALVSISQVTAAAAGYNHTLARKSDGTVWAWGSNYFGQLGVPNNVGSSMPNSLPIAVVTLSGISTVAAGANHSLALTNGGQVKSWGRNNNGQLGNGVVADTADTTPAIVNNLTNVTSIEAGVNFSLALRSNGSVWAWGSNGYGQLGASQPDAFAHNAPSQVNVASVNAIAAGGWYALALLQDGTLAGWGYNGYGELGDGTSVNRYLPGPVQGMTDIMSASSFNVHTLALSADGAVWAWGYNTYGQLGDDSNVNRNSPIRVPGLTNIVAVSGGSFHSLAVDRNGAVWAWGSNLDGELGISPALVSSRATPAVIAGLTGVKTVAAGYYYSVALKEDGTVWTWGKNEYGQLGLGGTDTNEHPLPTQVPGLNQVVAIARGIYHVLAVKSNGTVWAWGRNNYGQLGDGTTDLRAIPTQVTGLTNIIALAVGSYHNLALKADGTVWTWGLNDLGLLGLGTTDNNEHPVPAMIPGLDGVLSVAAGTTHSLALRYDGSVRAWGSNQVGQLGMGSVTNQNYPSPMTTLSMPGVGGIACGYNYCIALLGSEVAGQIELEGIAPGAPAQTLFAEFRPSYGYPGQPFRRVVPVQANGSFSIPGVLPNQYALWLKSPKWLADLKSVNTRDGNAIGVTALLKAGDANNDNSVDVLDLDLLIQAFDSTDGAANWFEGADLNCDGSVDVLDLDLLILNFDQVGDA